MKKLLIISVFALLISAVGTASAQSHPDGYLGLPGDNLDLYATMKLFQESETLEGFERSLNDVNLHINNLDLNGDNLVDYLMVDDYVDGNVHNIVLRDALNKHETQDVAVFIVQQFNDGSAQIQLIGDEALYGPNYIVEPIYADSQETPNPGYIGNTGRPVVVTVTRYEVATWPVIRFIYRPSYVRWQSSWTWGYYPSYWNPWRPLYWHTYYGYQTHFHNYYYKHYRHWNHYRYSRYNDYYRKHVRTYSPKVAVRIKDGDYRHTYSRPDLRRNGDKLYKQTRKQNSRVRDNYSKSRSRTSSPQSVSGRSSYGSKSNSGRRSDSNTLQQKNTNSTVNRASRNTRKSTTVQPRRSASSSSSVNRKTEVFSKPKTTRNIRTERSSTVRQNSNSSRRSSTAVSHQSISKPKAPSRSVRSKSSSSQQKKPVIKSRSSKNKRSQSQRSPNERSGRR
ncbi:MAG TPA: hypothetical protein VKA27_08980 [Sunxiuqinia sp.]|nr:hypothetical protein [Sunxiuqinia sp.]